MLSTVLGIASSPDPTTAIIAGGGVAGACLVGLFWSVVTGRLVSGKEYDRVVEENHDLRQQFPNVVTALTLSTSALAQSTTALQESAGVQRDTLVLLELHRRKANP